jgi:hypothetical protein
VPFGDIAEVLGKEEVLKRIEDAIKIVRMEEKKVKE